MSGPTKAELTEQLDDIRRVLEGQERQLLELDQAQNHGRWTAGGELVLVGDNGQFGNPQGDPDTWTTGQVAEIDGTAAIVTTVAGQHWRYAQCAELIGRGRFPKDPGG